MCFFNNQTLLEMSIAKILTFRHPGNPEILQILIQIFGALFN
jgi:hypothetical protein